MLRAPPIGAPTNIENLFSGSCFKKNRANNSKEVHVCLAFFIECASSKGRKERKGFGVEIPFHHPHLKPIPKNCHLSRKDLNQDKKSAFGSLCLRLLRYGSSAGSTHFPFRLLLTKTSHSRLQDTRRPFIQLIDRAIH